MIRLLTIVGILMTLAIFGCDQSEESKPAPTASETAEKQGEEGSRRAGSETADAGDPAKAEEQAEPGLRNPAEETNVMAITAAEKPAEKITRFPASTRTEKPEGTRSNEGRSATMRADESDRSGPSGLASVRVIMGGGIEIQKGEEMVRLTSAEARFVRELLNKMK